MARRALVLWQGEGDENEGGLCIFFCFSVLINWRNQFCEAGEKWCPKMFISYSIFIL
jgi:hypothetical protein